ncbi:ATP-binding protein [soil metagenome]
MFNSIRTKLTLWYLAVLAITVISFSAAAYFVMWRALRHDTDQRLIEMGRNFDVALKAELEDETGAAGSEKAISEVVNEMRFRDYQFQIVTTDGKTIASTTNFSVVVAGLTDTKFQNVEVNSQPQRVFRRPLTTGKIEYQLLIFHSLEEQDEVMGRLAAILLLGVPITLILAGFGGYFLARKSLSPMVEMGHQAAQIGAQNLNERISIKNRSDELGDLATVFNDLLARLDASFEQQRRFMADASHELRTPLAIVRGESEVALSKDKRPLQEYKESLNIVHDESKRLTRIVEDLFTLARADSGHFIANLEPVYLDEIAGEAARSIKVLADKKNISVSFASEIEIPYSGDTSLIRRMFLNVLDNAVKYTTTGGHVRVECRLSGDRYEITFADSGIGIPPAEQKNIFDRFYRVDKARSRSGETETSGAGLGLAIAKWIAELHEGNISLLSSGEFGSIFIFEFPAASPDRTSK